MPSKLSSVYLQFCSVCKAELSSKVEWLKHLVQENHQNLARKECLEKWDGKMRKCCLIIFTKVPLTEYSAVKIVNHFSNKLCSKNISLIVTDFIWWKDRLHIAILQFESKKKANDVVKDLPSQSNIKIDETQNIQVKSGSELKSLEWHAILPPTSHQTYSQPEQHSSRKTTKRDINDECLIQPPKRPKIDENANICTTTSFHHNYRIDSSSILYSGRPPPSELMTSVTHPLQFEYWSIRKAMIIRDVQYEYVISAVRSLQLILSKFDPDLEVSLFRNWFLKLKYPAAKNHVFIYVHSNKVSQDPNILCKLVKNIQQRDFKVLKSRKKGQLGLLYLKHVPSKINIFLKTSQTKGCLKEVQVCRLMEYMCQFDPRCYPLITLACYLVMSNNINVGGDIDTENMSELNPQYTIQWLVLFFMYQQRFIPTPAQVMERCGGEEVSQINGSGDTYKELFHPDQKFVAEWKSEMGKRHAAHKRFCTGVEESSEEFILNLLKLFDKFLTFCSWNLGATNELILNLRHGILVFARTNLRKNMTLEEIKVFREALNIESTKQQLEKRGFYMTHPILLNQSISTSENIKKLLKRFGKVKGNLSRFFTHLENFGAEKACQKIGSLIEVLTIKNE